MMNSRCTSRPSLSAGFVVSRTAVGKGWRGGRSPGGVGKGARFGGGGAIWSTRAAHHGIQLGQPLGGPQGGEGQVGLEPIDSRIALGGSLCCRRQVMNGFEVALTFHRERSPVGPLTQTLHDI